MEYNEFVKSWNPPHGDIPFRAWESRLFSKEKETLYKFPWYHLGLTWLYYGVGCWWKTGTWPMRILYFPKNRKRDKELYVKILRENGLLQ